jgi:ABC-type nitrate/sulfonate/bicarbonate transport system ATPase subunit
MMISIRSLSKSFSAPEGKTIQALRDCSLDITRGSFTVFIGKSGSGKTTLLKLIAGLEQPDSGSVDFFVLESQRVNDKQMANMPSAVPKLGFMFQDPRLLPWLTVEQNLALAFPSIKTKAEKAAIRNEIMRILSLTGLSGRAASLPHELSGGMAQRVALARCLCRNPVVLLLDEPLCSLDTFTRLHLRNELEKLRQQLGLTVILVTHDIEDAVFFGDRIFLLNEGKLDGEIPIPMKRPRDYRSAEFHEYCRKIESTLIDGWSEVAPNHL